MRFFQFRLHLFAMDPLKKRILPCFITFVMMQILVQAQINIVPNPSFENTLSCPTGAAGWTACANWNNVNMNVGPGTWGTPDYFHPCGGGGTAPVSTFAGTCSPHSGIAYMALVLYNNPYPDYREYLSCKLNVAMTPGTRYTVSFWITNGTGVISPWIIKNVGVHFSASALTQSGWSPINVTPQCEVTNTIASNTWVNYTFSIIPTATWNYLTIGAFRSDANNSPMVYYPNPGGNPSVYANYFIDDISVFAPLVEEVKESDLSNRIRFFPNPATETIHLDGQQNGLTVKTLLITNSLGETVMQLDQPSDLQEVNVSGLARGVYFIHLRTNQGVSLRKFVKE